jgi:hypothetical protein
VGVSAAAQPFAPRRDVPGRGGAREAGGGRKARGDPEASHACELLGGFPVRGELKCVFAEHEFAKGETGVLGDGFPIFSVGVPFAVMAAQSFGNEPARVPADLVQMLQSHDADRSQDVQTLFKSGDNVLIQEGPFAGLEAIYQMKDGEGRVMVLIELMSKPAQLKLQPAQLRKA